jgi:hypothetical protein
MSSNLNKLVSNLNKQTNKTSKNPRKPRVKGKRLPNNRKRRANIIRGRKIAAASAQNFRKKFTMLRQNGNSVRVTGRDLIYSIPDDLTSPIQDTNVITVIPANPAYWKGTRIAALASGYQNYRPIVFKITYIPMCAVTQQGNVIGGTIWDDGIDNDNLQQSLRTSNGGFMTQCYVPHTTQIRPKTNLQFNLYRMGGEFSSTSNPFIFVALAIGCKNVNNQRVTPGYFYVTWSFELKNPIGSINTYNNSGLTTYQNLQLDMNNTIININPNSEIPFGAYIDVEEGEGDQPIPMYNGTPIEIAETTPIWAFTSVTKNSNTKSINKQIITYNGITTSEIRLGYQGYSAYIIPAENHYDIYIPINTFTTNRSWRIQQTETALLVTNINQNFGTIVGQEDITVTVYIGESSQGTSQQPFTHYTASKEYYTTQLANNRKINENKSTPPKIYIKKATLPKIQEPIKEDINDEEEVDIPETEILINRRDNSQDKKRRK